MIPRVLFVCSGNVCRSPFAEALFRRVAGEVRLEDAAASSAGTLGLRGRPASSAAIRVAREFGVGLDAHRSRPLSEGLVRGAEVVLAMEEGHRGFIADRWPRLGARVRLLREYEDADRGEAARGVFDPIGMSDADYRHCYETIARCVVNVAFALKHPE